ncbi:MAG: glycosyltransferase family 9 protein [Planctomycetota bacterium]|jgi:ADP-heptose:LPS heptosyltransferase|nr:glycosyltransferase family 9 protein [Planctomycetota bacterium]
MGQNTERFLIVRLSSIGDTIHALPLAAALKRLHPGCRLGWIAEAPSAPLIVGNPLVDWRHILPRGWLKSLSAVLAARRALAAERFDIAFDVQGLAKSAIAARLSGARTRIGFERGEGRELAPWLDNRLVRPTGTHVVDKVRSLLVGIGEADPGAAEFVFPPCPDREKQAIDAFVAARAGGDGFILLGPWGSFAAKRWPLARFGRLAALLREKTGWPSLVLGHGPEERGAVERLAAGASGDLFPAPDLSIPGVAELARRARLFVGCDSFPMHAAAGVGCRTLGLFGVTDPARLGPYGPRGAVVHERLALPGSTRERRRLDQAAMLALGVDRVTRAALDLLARP